MFTDWFLVSVDSMVSLLLLVVVVGPLLELGDGGRSKDPVFMQ